MFNPDEAGRAAAHATKLLDRIATALDCPVSAFSERESWDASQTAELLRFWLQIKHEQDRLKVLSIIRAVVLEPTLTEPLNR